MTTWPPKIVTGIGTLPHTDPREAVELVASSIPETPHWPQLPQRSFLEFMELQCLEGLPCVRIDADRKQAYIDSSGDVSGELEFFYERYLEVLDGGAADHFAISEEYAAGLHAFVEYLETSGTRPVCIKGQITGPFTLGLGLTDQNRRAIIYDNDFADVVVKGMGLKGYCNALLLKKYSDFVIVFVDEPVLTGFGSSAFITISREQVIEKLNEVIDLIHQAGALVGSHCCGNTDWGILAQTKMDVISFDAYNYADTVAIYAKEIRDFLKRGGRLAWGIVPNDGTAEKIGVPAIREKLEQSMQALAGHDIDLSMIKSQAIFTPSCGAGLLSVPQAAGMYRILSELF